MRVGASRGRRCPATRSSAAWGARPPLIEVAQRLSPEELRGDDSWRWLIAAQRDNYLDHLAVIEPWTAELRPPAPSLMPTAPITPSPNLSIEAIVAVDTPREFRLHPRDRVVAFTAEAAGARQLFTLTLRGGYPFSYRLGEARLGSALVARRASPCLRPRRRGLGDRVRRVAPDPGGGQAPAPAATRAGRPTAVASPSCRAVAAGRIWLIDAPVPRRGRPATEPKPPRSTVLTETGLDVDAYEWSPDGNRIAVMARRGPAIEETSYITLVDVATGTTRVVAGEQSVDAGARWLPDGSLLFVSDADGWSPVSSG